MRKSALFVLPLLVGCATTSGSRPEASLSLWNDGAAKSAIVAFVEKTTTPGAPGYLPQEDRIAIFDNDGTLWGEKPLYIQMEFELARLKARLAEHPEIADDPVLGPVLRGEKLDHSQLPAIVKALFDSHTGETEPEHAQNTRSFLAEARHENGRLLKQLTYAPMVELLDYLRAHGFRVMISTGGEIGFVRAVSWELYRIPPEDVVGSWSHYEYDSEKKDVVRRDFVEFNDKARKPANIELHVGRRPILAFGNSDGDYEMLEWVANGGGLSLLLHHDDEAREYAYDKGTERALETAPKSGWVVVSIRDDFTQVYAD